MATYVDVVLGRLLLLERLLGEGQLLSLLPALAAGDSLAAVISQRGVVEATRQEQVEANVKLVLLAERERTLARLLHEASLLPDDKILGEFEVSRGTSFGVSLGARLIEHGLLDQARVDTLYVACDAALGTARLRRERELGSLILEATSPSADQRLGQVFQLCEGVLDLSPHLDRVRQAVQPGPSDPLEAAKAESSEALRLAPEKCPIYGYEIIEELGKGAMGVVYKARHIFTDRITALKILPLQLAEKTQYLERFKREAMAVMRLQHENIVRAYDFGGSDEYYYLALEFVEGQSLHDLLQREGKLSERRSLEIGRQIALGLGCAHEQGVIHRDVKPENILLSRDGVAKLCDFGIVKLKDMDDGQLTMAGTTVGTPFYISPEQARGDDDLDIRSDLYSLGISLFHLATGEIPFKGNSQGAILVRHILEEVPDPRTVNPALSAEFAEILGRLTRKKRDDRYLTPALAAEAIEAVLG